MPRTVMILITRGYWGWRNGIESQSTCDVLPRSILLIIYVTITVFSVTFSIKKTPNTQKPFLQGHKKPFYSRLWLSGRGMASLLLLPPFRIVNYCIIPILSILIIDQYYNLQRESIIRIKIQQQQQQQSIPSLRKYAANEIKGNIKRKI